MLYSIRKSLAVLLSVALLMGLCMPLTSFAASDDTEYLFKLKETAPAVMILAGGNEDYTPVPHAEGYFTTTASHLQTLMNAGLIEFAVPDVAVELLDSPISNDPALPQQWYMDALRPAAAWDAGLNGEGVTVAVIDSGLVQGHEDLDYSNITGYNILEDQLETDNSDVTGHGTLVTGLIAAQRDNGIGVAGLADQANILSIRCFSERTTNLSVVVSAVKYAIAQNVDVINMSFGESTGALQEVLAVPLKQAQEQGILLIAAVGNSGAASLLYPAALDSVIGVGMVKQDGTVDRLSQRNSSVFVTAPGRDIYGIGYTPATAYRTDSGTSFSTPIVSAIGAMAKQADNAIDNDGFRYLLQACAQDKGAVGYDTDYGWGTVDINRFASLLTEPTAITYESNGGTLPPGSLEGYVISKADGRALPTPTKGDATFLGWYTDAQFSGQPVTAVPGGSVAPVKYYAKWKAQEAPVALGVKSIELNGHTAQALENNQFQLTLPYGADLTQIEVSDIHVTLTDDRATIENPSLNNSVFEFIVKSSTASENYTLTITAAASPLPSVVPGQSSQSGTATPASYDGFTAFVPYTTTVSSWFENVTDGYDAAVQSGSGTVTIDGTTVTYIPHIADSGTDVTLTLKGKGSTGLSADAVTVTIAVGALPVSNSKLATTSLSYDKKNGTDRTISLKLFGNELTSITRGSSPLVKDTHYTYTIPSISGDDGSVTLKKSYLDSLSTGSHTVSFVFSGGRTEAAKTLSLTVTIADTSGEGGGGGGIGGGGGGVPPKPEPQVYLLEDNAAPISYTVDKDGTAQVTIAKTDVDKLVSAGKPVTVDLSKVSGALSASLSADQVRTLSQNGFNLKLPQGGIHLDKDGVNALSTAKTVEFKAKKADNLSGRPAFELTLSADGKALTQLSQPVTIVLPYSLAKGESPKGLSIARVGEGGQLIPLSSAWDSGASAITAQTDHFSTFVILYQTPWQNPFGDMKESDWFYDSVAYTVDKKLFSGISADRFDPQGSTSRAMLITLLWRLADSPVPQTAHGFTDVDSGLWYSDAIAWAAQSGITQGTTATTFEPERAITRQELAVILSSFAKVMGHNLPQKLSLVSFTDEASFAPWAKDAITQMQQMGLLQGKGNNAFAPQDTASRAELAAVLHRYLLLLEQ